MEFSISENLMMWFISASMEDSYSFWQEAAEKGPEEWREKDLKVIEADRGKYMGFVKIVAKKKANG